MEPQGHGAIELYSHRAIEPYATKAIDPGGERAGNCRHPISGVAHLWVWPLEVKCCTEMSEDNACLGSAKNSSCM